MFVLNQYEIRNFKKRFLQEYMKEKQNKKRFLKEYIKETLKH